MTLALPVGVSITGTGLFTPTESISNAELAASLSRSVEHWNALHVDEISAGTLVARDLPDEAFILKASGIASRHVMEKSGVLDPERMRPHLPLRTEDELGVQAEMSMPAIHEALAQAGRQPGDVDAVIVGCSNLQRAYPAVAIEIQNELGADGWAFDMNVACSSATFSIQSAVDALRNGTANRVIVVNPEITSGHNNFELRDHHFIFGDACTALVLERTEDAVSDGGSGGGPGGDPGGRGGGDHGRWDVLGTKLATKFSNNIRNDFGFLNASEDGERDAHELVFRQNGQSVFKEVCPLVVKHITGHLDDVGVAASDVRRFWLHQANLKMNQLIAKGVLGRVPDEDEAPVILDEYANTSSAGSVIAFHKCRGDLESGDIGVICSFGAGYSVGSIVVQRA